MVCKPFLKCCFCQTYIYFVLVSRLIGQNCNCLRKNECPLDGKCLTTNTIYKATVLSDKPGYKDKIYIDLAETTFKKRFANHKKSFTLIPKSFGATNFRTKKCPKVCNAENINFFCLVRKFITPKLLEKYFFSNFVLQALIGMKTIFFTL